MELDSYTDAGIIAALGLVNGLTARHAGGRPVVSEPFDAIRRVLAVDPPSLAQLTSEDAAGFLALAGTLRAVFSALDAGDVDTAASDLNTLLARHPATPHLAREDGVWRLHHHPGDAALLPMWTSICAEGVARMIGSGQAHRFGLCAAGDCDQAYLDTSRNASRRYCSLPCQNRMKTQAFRARRNAGD